MRKLKLIPTIIMVVLSVAVLSVGIFAAAGISSSKIKGTVNFNVEWPDVKVAVYDYDAEGNLNSNPTWGPVDANTTTSIPVGTITLTAEGANTKDDLKALAVKKVIRLTNASGVKLGAYFTKNAVTNEASFTDLTFEEALATTSGNDELAKAVFPYYTALNAKEGETNGSCDLEVSFMLTDFTTDGGTINLSTTENTISLNVERFNNLLAPTVISGTNGKIPAGAYTTNRVSGVVVIEEGVTEIGEYAFSGCSDMVGVILPDGLKKIGERAFADCTGLSTITIPSTVTYMPLISYFAPGDVVAGMGGSIFDNCLLLEFNSEDEYSPTIIGGLREIIFEPGFTLDASLYELVEYDWEINDTIPSTTGYIYMGDCINTSTSVWYTCYNYLNVGVTYENGLVLGAYETVFIGVQ